MEILSEKSEIVNRLHDRILELSKITPDPSFKKQYDFVMIELKKIATGSPKQTLLYDINLPF